MPFTFVIQPATATAEQVPDPTDLGGEDILLGPNGLEVTPAGDWATVTGVAAAKQSVLRELPASPGSFVRRPQWGGGLQALMFKGATPARRDEAVARAKARLRANPRISRVREVSGEIGEYGIQLTVDADAAGGKLNLQDLVFKP